MGKSKTHIAALLLVLAAACLPARAQLEDLFKQVGGTPAAEGKEAPDLRAQLGKWKAEAERGLERIEPYDGAENLPEGVTPSDLSSRRRILEQTLLAASRHLLILDETETSKAALEAAKAESDAWKGFDTPPPHSVLMVDELVERKEALEDKQASSRSSSEVLKTSLASLLKESKATEEEIAAMPKADANNPAALWKLESARARQRSLFIRASALQRSIALLEEQMAAGAVELALFSKKIKLAGDDLVFTEEDLALINAASADRQAALRKEAVQVRKRMRKAAEDKAAAASALAKLRESEAPDPELLALAELNAETAAIQADALQSVSDFLDSFSQIEAFIPEAYEHRFTLMGAKDAAERKAALANLAALNQRLDAWDVVAKNELDSVAADIGKEQSRASLLPADDPKLAPLNRQRAALWEKQSVIQRAHQSIQNQRRTIARWLADYGAKEKAPWYEPAMDTVTHAWRSVQKLWNIPVNRYEETIEIDGQKVVEIRFVSLGAILTALILFIIAYFIAAKISRRVQGVLVHREVIGENQARTLRTWVMLLVALLLALATLSWLSIPLTIFAFLAGALAIGVGFGTQTIIKNFISGIILLFERKVRVGDIIEVDGTLGVVSEINTRSSIVRGFNGIENLIPNSLFLENRVVNWTLNSRFLRRELKVGVAYGTPTKTVIEILNEAAERHGLILKDPAPFATMSNFGDNSLDFTLYFWIELNDKTNGLVVDSDLRIMIEKRLTELGIHVPFPQRDIHLSADRPLQVEIAGKKDEAAPEKPSIQ